MGNWLVLIIYFILNMYGYILMWSDKERAKNKEWRISERQIWITAILGGAFGLTIGMNAFRHKTKHMNFRLLLPLLSIITTGLYLYFLIELS